MKTAIITTITDLFNWEMRTDVEVQFACYVDGVDGEKSGKTSLCRQKRRMGVKTWLCIFAGPFLFRVIYIVYNERINFTHI